jgi:uncharacterized membrane protein
MVFLRLIHLFAAVLWVGGTYFMTLFVAPSAAAVGADAQKFMAQFTRRSGLQRWMTSAAILTILSGLLMYGYLYRGLAPLNVGNTLALTVGALAGIAAGGIGGSIGGLTRRIGQLGEEMAKAGGPPKPEQLAQMAKLQETMATRSAVNAILLTVALAGMTLSEYFAFIL